MYTLVVIATLAVTARAAPRELVTRSVADPCVACAESGGFGFAGAHLKSGLGLGLTGLGVKTMGLHAGAIGVARPAIGLRAGAIGLGAPAIGLRAGAIGLGAPAIGMRAAAIGIRPAAVGVVGPIIKAAPIVKTVVAHRPTVIKQHYEIPVAKTVHYADMPYVAGHSTTIHKPSIAAPLIAAPRTLIGKKIVNPATVTVSKYPAVVKTINKVAVPYNVPYDVPAPYAVPTPVKTAPIVVRKRVMAPAHVAPAVHAGHSFGVAAPAIGLRAAAVGVAAPAIGLRGAAFGLRAGAIGVGLKAAPLGLGARLGLDCDC